MGEMTKIGWCDHTFNPWWGCTRVSPGCEHCYAETFSKRVGLQVWGTQANRRFFSDKHWRDPVKWNAAAEKAGKRARVFCASMADVFEDGLAREPREDGLGDRTLDTERARLFELIEATPWLDWLLLTKRPHNVRRMVPQRWLTAGFPPNVWIGATAEDQKRYEERLPVLAQIPARVRFLSIEPQLEHVSLRWHLRRGGISWVICGGESGPKARPFNIEWARSLLRECRVAGVPFFMKQVGSKPYAQVPYGETSCARGGCGDGDFCVAHERYEFETEHSKGEDMAEWPADLRVQEWPA